MQDFARLPLEALLAPHAYPCDCGKTHSVPLAYLKIEAGAVRFLPDALAAIGAKRPFILCDENTRAAAWDRVRPVLDAAAIPYALFTFQRAHLEPDEYAVGALSMAFDPSCDAVLAIGSGVLNDCAKVLAHVAGVPSMVIATAPSMDGYASNSSSMVVDGVKTTLYNACPAAILADTDIVKAAPMRMLWAGFGDVIAKYVAICEWRLAHLVTGEYYCGRIAAMMRAAVAKVVDNADALVRREPAAVEAVMEALVLSGIAMGYATISRPASGLEHYFSHLWEMMALERGERSDLHGIQVGVGTPLALSVLRQLERATPSAEQAERAMRRFDPAAWEADIRRVFGRAAGPVLEIEAQAHKNSPERQAAHTQTLLAHWDEVVSIIREELPDTDALLATMRRLGMPVTPDDLGIPPQDVRDAYVHSRDIRDKYMTSSILWDLGLLEEIQP